MVWYRMMQVVWRLAGSSYLLIPWRSPLLRWRLETYGVLDERGQLMHADAITPRRFIAFLVSHAPALWRFLRWAAAL